MGWVTMRHNCTLENALAAIRKVVEEDIQEANGLLPNSHKEYPFSIEEDAGYGGGFWVTGYPFGSTSPEEKRLCQIKVLEERININVHDGARKEIRWGITVTQRWDDQKNACILSVDDEPKTPQEISQMALEWIIFKKEFPPII